jgi:hypothetical protein
MFTSSYTGQEWNEASVFQSIQNICCSFIHTLRHLLICYLQRVKQPLWISVGVHATCTLYGSDYHCELTY